MTKRFLSLLAFQFSVIFAFAQETGGVVGKLLDAELNNEPLAFANILIKGTTTGTTAGTNKSNATGTAAGTNKSDANATTHDDGKQ